MIKNGHSVSPFHSIFTDHLVCLQSWCCSNKRCRWHLCPSIKSRLGNSLHTDLQGLYCELGVEQSYGKSARILTAFSSGKRAINNHQRIHKTVQTVGEAVTKQEQEKPEKPASTLVAQVDGGYVHDWEQRGHNYEVKGVKS